MTKLKTTVAALVMLFGASAVHGQAGPYAAGDALDELNAQRMQRGLRPYVRDDGLTAGAINVAVYRAERMAEGHTGNDFAGLPPGVSAEAAGCAAWPQGMGFGACCSYENWNYAGAAAVIGRDGRRYMHLFVRNSPTFYVSQVQIQQPGKPEQLPAKPKPNVNPKPDGKPTPLPTPTPTPPVVVQPPVIVAGGCGACGAASSACGAGSGRTTMRVRVRVTEGTGVVIGAVVDAGRVVVHRVFHPFGGRLRGGCR